MVKLKELIKKTYYILTPAHKKLGILVFGMTCVGSLLECLGVSIIIPLVTAIQDYESIKNSEYLRNVDFVQNMGYNQIVFMIVLGVILIYIFKNLYFIFLAWIRIKFSCKIQRETSIHILTSMISRGYQYFLNINYGEYSRAIQRDVTAIFNVTNASFRLASESLTIAMICILMFIADWQLAISIVILALLCLFMIYGIFRRRIYNTGLIAREYQARIEQTISQIYYGIKDVVLFKKQKFFVRKYENDSIINQKAICAQTVGTESPTYIIEGICVSGLMLAVGLKIVLGGAGAEYIAILAAFAVGAFRILPSLGRISTSINQMTAAIPQVDALYASIIEARRFGIEHPELQVDVQGNGNSLINRGGMIEVEQKRNVFSEGKFIDKIELEHICFGYSEELGNVLNNVSLDIKKGQAVAFIGESGSGKSTLVDVLLGLLIPQNGFVKMDGQETRGISDRWAETIAYVPQSVFLTDDTIRGNVAFGEFEKDINEDLVIDALEKARMLEFINKLPDGLDTMVGDRGVRLSGGQRQRIAIARALYHRPEILVLDEATSALDNDTEAAIMDAINSLYGQVTLIIVAHRLTTVRNCDVIYEVSNGCISVKCKEDLF